MGILVDFESAVPEKACPGSLVVGSLVVRRDWNFVGNAAGTQANKFHGSDSEQALLVWSLLARILLSSRRYKVAPIIEGHARVGCRWGLRAPQRHRAA